MRIMMGLLGNIAEVEELRPRLMEEAYVKIFYEYLNSRLPGYARVEVLISRLPFKSITVKYNILFSFTD